MADDDIVNLQSWDGQEVSVEVRVAKMSETIKNLIEDAGTDNPIPLPNVAGKMLSKVVQYCKYHAENPVVRREGEEPRADDICEWDQDFCKMGQADLFELILAANYLDIKDLLDLTCKAVANMIKGKTPEEVRATFNIKADFTPEEEKQVLEENEWLTER